MTVIDLGADVEFKVSYNGQTYTLREPTVKEIETFKDAGETGVAPVIKFLSLLGMPEEIASNMPASKVKKLVDGLVQGMSEKK